jgi:hypothetical protein
MWWPELAAQLQQIAGAHNPAQTTIDAVQRSDRELLEELLDTVRGLARPRPGPVSYGYFFDPRQIDPHRVVEILYGDSHALDDISLPTFNDDDRLLLHFIARGMTDSEISLETGRSLSRIQRLIELLRRKADCPDRGTLAAFAHGYAHATQRASEPGDSS